MNLFVEFVKCQNKREGICMKIVAKKVEKVKATRDMELCMGSPCC